MSLGVGIFNFNEFQLINNFFIDMSVKTGAAGLSQAKDFWESSETGGAREVSYLEALAGVFSC